MNRFVRVVAAAALAVGGVGAVGCVGTGHSAGCTSGGCGVGGGGSGIGGGGLCRTFIDPCYPERYNAVARTEVLAPFDLVKAALVKRRYLVAVAAEKIPIPAP